MDIKALLPGEIQKPRDFALDGLRTLAVLLMIASHTTRLIIWDSRRAWSRFSLLIEPLTASLFLILVGASLVYSWRSANLPSPAIQKKWFRKQGVRAGGLWALSCLFYTLEEGFHWPDVIFLSGILATIAYTILAGMFLISLRQAIPILILVCLILFGLENYLDHFQIQWFFVNAGNSPMLPLFLFACLGALGALALESSKPWVRPTIITCAILILVLILQRHSFTEVFSKPIGRYETVRILTMGEGEAKIEKSIPYYNLRPILVPMVASLIVLVYAGLKLLGPILVPLASILFRMGRYSLDVYIIHLALLAILVLSSGLRPLKLAWQGDVVVIGLIVVGYFWSWGRERFRGSFKKPLL